MSTETVSCKRHGEQRATLVCTHIAQAADSGNQVGFFWSREDNQKFPDAWCKECNSELVSLDSWTKVMFELASFKVTCSDCYKEIKKQQIGEHAL